MVRVVLWSVAGLWLTMGVAAAEGTVHAFIGGWAYDISGTTTTTTTTTERYNLKDDLGLKVSDRKSYALGYTPAGSGWVPALEFDYVHVAAEGMQTVSTGLLGGSTVVDNRTDVDDYELTLRWPWQRGDFTLAGGLTLAALNGVVVVADADTGQQQTQKVDEIFPRLSLALAWQPLPSLRFSLSGDYVQYNDNRADALEARVFWKCLGPIGLEGGYRQRRYKIRDPMNDLDARVAGARIGVRMDLPY